MIIQKLSDGSFRKKPIKDATPTQKKITALRTLLKTQREETEYFRDERDKAETAGDSKRLSEYKKKVNKSEKEEVAIKKLLQESKL